jgi:spore coat polysaccharide biosynthesis protein SpsF
MHLWSAVTIVAQARTGSTRLPGKVLRNLGSRPVLEHLLRRLVLVHPECKVVVATTTERADDAIEELGRRRGLEVIRGAVDDVLDRFEVAFDACGGSIGVRITADCPLIDPAIVRQALDVFFGYCGRADYVSNTLQRSYPRGYDVEVFKVSALRQAAAEAVEPEEREHVTPFLYRNPSRFSVFQLTRPDPHRTGDWRLTLDTTEDLELLQVVFNALEPASPDFALEDVERFLLARPHLLEINRDIVQKAP